MIVCTRKLGDRAAIVAALLCGTALSATGAACAHVETISPHGMRIAPLPQTGATIMNTPKRQVIARQGVLPGRPGQPPPRPLTTLKDGLDAVAWDAAERGPLLVVAPEKARPAWQVRQEQAPYTSGQILPEPPPPPEAAANGQYRLPDLADYFGRRIVRLNGVTVAAPGTMVVFNTHPGKPDLYAGLPPQGKLRMLEATLTDAQWRMLASAQGLGVGDLAPPQRELFLSFLPDPIRIQTVTVLPGGGIRYRRDSSAPPVVLAGREREGVRLRVSRAATYFVPYAGQENVFLPAVVGGQDSAAGETHVLAHTYDPNVRNKAFGQEVRAEIPARLKPQQIDFDAAALQVPVALSGTATVGDLVARIREATRSEIYVDGGMAKQPVWVRAGTSDTVRAGELLKALCWGLTGAVRSLGQGVFILTDDIEGYGTRLARLSDWYAPLEKMRDRQYVNLTNAVRNKRPLRYIGFMEGDPTAPAADLQKQIEESWKSPATGRSGFTVDSATLPAALRDAIEKTVRNQSRGTAMSSGEPATRVTISEVVEMNYIIPGIGELRDGLSGAMPGDLLPSPLPGEQGAYGGTAPGIADTITVPASFAAGAVLCVAPTTPDAARAAVQAARVRGMRQIWVTVPAPAAPEEAAMQAATAAGKAILSAAIAEAIRAKPSPAVVCVAPLLTLAPATAEPRGPAIVKPQTASEPVLDQNILGESGREAARRRYATASDLAANPDLARFDYDRSRDWLNPTAPGVAARLKRRLRDLAATPGLAGLALTSAASPEYDSPDPLPAYLSLDATGDFGYTLARRIEFVRANGYDPVDILSGAPVGVDSTLPFMNSQDPWAGMMDGSAPKDDPSNRWRAARYAVVERFLAGLCGDVAAAAHRGDGTPLPLYLHSLKTGGRYGSSGDWYSRWSKADSLPKGRYAMTLGGGAGPLPPGDAARAVSAENLLVIPYIPYPRSPDAPRSPDDDLPPPVRLAHVVNASLRYRKGAWRGLVLDLSQMPCDDALKLLDGAMPPRSAAAR